jgi:hypothetical protein
MLEKWQKVVFVLFLIFLSMWLSFMSFHFTTKLMIWYARWKGWL